MDSRVAGEVKSFSKINIINVQEPYYQCCQTIDIAKDVQISSFFLIYLKFIQITLNALKIRGNTKIDSSFIFSYYGLKKSEVSKNYNISDKDSDC